MKKKDTLKDRESPFLKRRKNGFKSDCPSSFLPGEKNGAGSDGQRKYSVSEHPREKQRKMWKMQDLVAEQIDKMGPEGIAKFAEEHTVEFWKIGARLMPTKQELTGADGQPLNQLPVVAPPTFQSMEEWEAYQRKEQAEEQKRVEEDRKAG